MFRVVEFVLDSSSARAAGPGADLLYLPVMGAVGAVGLLSPQRASGCFLALACLPTCLFGGTSLLFVQFVFVTRWDFLAKVFLKLQL